MQPSDLQGTIWPSWTLLEPLHTEYSLSKFSMQGLQMQLATNLSIYFELVALNAIT